MAEYVNFPIVTDQESLSQSAVEYLQLKIPGWEASPGSFEMWLIEAFAALAADTRDISSDVPASIFRYFGAKLVNVPPIDEQHSTVDTTWAANDTLGYEIPEGTFVSIRNDLNEEIPFEVLSTVVIAPGSLTTVTGEVVLISVDPGAATAGLGGLGVLATPIDPLDFVNTITLQNITTGGVDAEDDDVYLSRLSERLQLLADRPILADDFAIMAKQTAGVERALAIDNFIPGVNEKQAFVHNGTGGSFALTWNGQQTAPIAYNAGAAAVQSALEALSNLVPGEVSVTGGPSPAVTTVEFTGTKGLANQAQMTGSTLLLTPGGSLISTTTSQEGAPDQSSSEKSVTVALVDANGAPVGSTIKSEVDSILQAKRELNFLVTVIDPTLTTINITFSAKAFSTFDVNDVKTRAEAAVSEYLSPQNWGVPPFGDQREWINTTTVRYLEVAQVIGNVEGLDYVTALTINTFSADLVITGVAPLTTPGTIVGTVT